MKSGVELLSYLADPNNRERVEAMARSLLGEEVIRAAESAFVRKAIIALGMALMEADAVDATRKPPASIQWILCTPESELEARKEECVLAYPGPNVVNYISYSWGNGWRDYHDQQTASWDSWSHWARINEPGEPGQ